MGPADPRAPCIIGVARRTWRPGDVEPGEAPEPLLMWEEVARTAALDCGPKAAGRVLDALDDVQVVYTQSWQYDDPVGRLCDRLDAEPERRLYSGIGGTTPQLLVQDAAEAILRGESDVAMVVGAEALETRRQLRKQERRPDWSFPEAERSPFPFEAPFLPSEVAHDLLHAWFNFALFDNARRAQRGTGLTDYRRELGELLAPFTEVAAASPHAWFPVARSAEDLITARPENRMVGYPYTKYMVSVMDVDMAACVILASDAAATALGVAPDRRVYLRGWCYATDVVYLGERDEMWASPAMAAASSEALARAGAGIDDIAHLDLYSCFTSALNLARDALGLTDRDSRPLTVTGGLPFHGGAGSDYVTHSIAAMAEALRTDPGSLGMVSGVGMYMTKHAFGVYSTDPGPALVEPGDSDGVQARLDAGPKRAIRDAHDGPATVVAYSVAHGRDGAPERGVAVCELADGSRVYARFTEPGALADAEENELVGRRVEVASGDDGVNTLVRR